jgi:hypothetical protein
MSINWARHVDDAPIGFLCFLALQLFLLGLELRGGYWRREINILVFLFARVRTSTQLHVFRSTFTGMERPSRIGY